MFNIVTASALRASPAPVTTTATFVPFDSTKQPNRKDVLQLRRSLLSMARDISTDGSAFGYTGLVVAGAEYNRITNNAPAYQVPIYPGNQVPQGANQLAAYQNEEHYKRELKKFEDYQAASKHMKAAVKAAVPAKYLEEIADPDVEYANVTLLEMLNHLFTNYGDVTREDLDANEADLKQPWNPPDPIETLWMQATRAQQFPPANDALSDSYILRAVVTNVRNTKKFESTLKRFDELPIANQDLARFKQEMNRAYKTWIRANTEATAATAGYHAANLAQIPATAPAPASKYCFIVGTHEFSYCWSHGLSQVRANAPEHNSLTCHNKKEGHQDDATFTNRMRGFNPLGARQNNRRNTPPAPNQS